MSFIYLNHLTIETKSPMAIGTGEREIGFDNQLIRDINNLPYLPSTSITGVWRHLTAKKIDDTTASEWFGQLEHKSKLIIGQGYLLDSQQNRVKGLISDNDIQQDPVLAYLKKLSPMHRERVRLNDRGIAIDKGKFDQILLPSGVRFCVTIQWQSESKKELEQFNKLLSLWRSEQFAFGADTSNGLGQVALISQSKTEIKLTDNPDAGETLRNALSPNPNSNNTIQESSPERPFATLSLRALGTWRSGQGSQKLSTEDKNVDADIVTFSEPRIEWRDNKAHITDHLPVLTGSSWKGIVAHRFAFHLRRLTKLWAESKDTASHEEWVKRPAEVDDLLGFANKSNGQGKAGHLIFHDTIIENYTPVIRYHNAIDRFTGGVIQGALYSEELLEKPEFVLSITAKPGASITELQKQALQATFDDMASGLLPIGAGSGRGHSLTEKNGTWDIDWNHLPVVEKTATVVKAG